MAAISEALDWWVRQTNGIVLYADSTFARLACANIDINFVHLGSSHPYHLAIIDPSASNGSLHRDGSRSHHISDPSGNVLERLWLPPGF